MLIVVELYLISWAYISFLAADINNGSGLLI